MSVDFLKRLVPRSLYGRGALILLFPVVTIQLVVSVVFIQRLFEDVTEQMTESVALEISRLVEEIEASPTARDARQRTIPAARALRIELDLPDPDPRTNDRRDLIDVSGRMVIPTLKRAVSDIRGIDLATNDDVVDLTVATRHGLVGMTFDRDRVSASNPHQLLVLMVGTSLLMTVIAYLFLKNQLRPIKRLAEAATAFGRGRTLPYRPAGATEVRTAGAAFLDMRHRIERQIEQRTMMLSSVSHDLRTPLTRLKLGLSMSDDPEATAMERDVAEMQRMLDTFLDFARDGALDDPVAVDPVALLTDVVENARRAGKTIDVGDLDAHGDAILRPLAITRALENLVMNAARHGSRARLSLATRTRALVFTIEDDGPGIAEVDRESALRPFTRLDSSRNQNRGGGMGLGLAIALDIARQHGGTLRLGQSASLGGLQVDLVIAR